MLTGMDYYRCYITELSAEVSRRNIQLYGDHNSLAEGLKRDDDVRGSETTTVETLLNPSVPLAANSVRTKGFESATPANLLVGQRIIHWSMNTFFPTLQLFFISGLSCTIDGGRLPDAAIGLDPNLRFRLTDITHEEDGHLVKAIFTDKFVDSSSSIEILQAEVAYRTSIAVKQHPLEERQLTSQVPLTTTIVKETHVVVGLRLSGMLKMAYVWARIANPTPLLGNKTWSDVRVASLRDDVPVPFLDFPQDKTKPGSKVTVVTKGSMIGSGR